ncbi:CLUMA_CG013100, isoform A [Clunio marinus]|uniref:CLUMA_CG013100, isoform A n=1 Tax=Clunio marinus TaxID=568069 RepID=A0A1J1IHW3_9DIPT|nr:CLUMA_CG013100, isoform A [Clunio marinus]
MENFPRIGLVLVGICMFDRGKFLVFPCQSHISVINVQSMAAIFLVGLAHLIDRRRNNKHVCLL